VQVNFQELLPRPWLARNATWPRVISLEIQISLKYWQGRKFGRRNIASRFRESANPASPYPGLKQVDSITIYPARGYSQGIYSRPTIIVGRVPGSLETAFRRHSHISQFSSASSYSCVISSVRRLKWRLGFFPSRESRMILLCSVLACSVPDLVHRGSLFDKSYGKYVLYP
jgi:hypothetical protein